MITKFRNLWYGFISTAIWTNEKIFFFPKIKNFYSGRLRQSPTIFDVGANRGQTIKFFQSIIEEPNIYAFEPSETVYGELSKLQSKTVMLHKFALGEKNENKVFYECVFDEVSSLQKPDVNSDYFKFKSKVLLVKPDDMFIEKIIPVRTMDEMVDEKSIKFIDILKIDVEGGRT